MTRLEERPADAPAAHVEAVDLDAPPVEHPAPSAAPRRRWSTAGAVAAVVALLAAGAVAASAGTSPDPGRPAPALAHGDLPRVVPARSAWAPGNRVTSAFGSGGVTMSVRFDAPHTTGAAMPGGRGDCTVFGPFQGRDAAARGRARALGSYAAAGCRRGLVLEATDRATDPARPFAGAPAPVDVGRCALRSSSRVTTEGGLTPTATTFSCRGGTLQQWVFPGELAWSLDGGRGVTDLVTTARRSVPVESPTVPVPMPAAEASEVPARYPGRTASDTAVRAGGAVSADGIDVMASPLVPLPDAGGSYLCTTVTRRNGSGQDARFSDADWTLRDPTGTAHPAGVVSDESFYPTSDTMTPRSWGSSRLCFAAPAAPGQYEIAYSSPLFGSTRAVWIGRLS